MKIPCKDCIAIAMCKSQLLTHETSAWRALEDEVIHRCSDLVKYMIQDLDRCYTKTLIIKDLNEKLPNELLKDAWRLFGSSDALSRLQDVEAYITDAILPEAEERHYRFKSPYPFVNGSRRKDYIAEIPCTNCMTFSKCNSIYIDYASVEEIFVTNIRERCSDALSYITQFEYPYAKTGVIEIQNAKDIVMFFKKHNRVYRRKDIRCSKSHIREKK